LHTFKYIQSNLVKLYSQLRIYFRLLNAIKLSNSCHSQLDWESIFFKRLWIPAPVLVKTGMRENDVNLMALFRLL